MVAPESTVEIKTKMKFTGKVTKISLAGALIDIGVGQPAVLHISQLPLSESGEAYKRVEEALQAGQEIEVWVKKVKDDHIELTMIKPLDLEWREIKKGMTVKGQVVRIEKFGIFVEIGAERPGLVHISEMAHGYVKTPTDMVKEGDEIEAQVLEVNRKKKQIKLSMKALQPEPVVEEPVKFAAAETQRVPREKPVKRVKKSRKTREGGDSTDFILSLSEPAAEVEAEPTAMEIALREAMDRAKTKKREQEEKVKKMKNVTQEQEDIFNRTLEHQKSHSA